MKFLKCKVVTIVFATLALSCLTGCSNSDPSSEVTNAAREFLNAAARDQTEAICSLTTPKWQENVDEKLPDMCISGDFSGEPETSDETKAIFASAVVDDDSVFFEEQQATVSVTFTGQGKTVNALLVFVEQGDVWLLDDIK